MAEFRMPEFRDVTVGDLLTRLAEFQEKAAKIKNKVAAAMVYPLIVMTMAIAIMGGTDAPASGPAGERPPG